MEESISLEETNKIRISLGLKPLTDDKAPAAGEEEAEENYRKQRETERKEKNAKRVADGIAKVKNKREFYSSLKGTTLGDLDGDDDSAIKWIKRSKKKEKDLAKKKQEELAKMEEGFLADYTEKDLEGLKVGHDLNALDEGEERILTLKDSRILDGDEDELQNEELADHERTKKRNDLKIKKRDYTGYDDDEFVEGNEGMKRKVLKKYDEDIDDRDSGFRLGSGTVQNSVDKYAQPVDGPIIVNKSLLNIDYSKNEEISDYLKPGDAGFKKPKTKKKRPSRRTAIDPESLGQEQIPNDAMQIDEKPVVRPAPDLDINFVDDDELQAALARQRRAKMKETRRLRPEDIARRVAEEKDMRADETDLAEVEEDASEGNQLVFDDTSEFVRSIAFDASEKPATNGTAHQSEVKADVRDVSLSRSDSEELEAGEVDMREHETEEGMLHAMQVDSERVEVKAEEAADLGTSAEQTYSSGMGSTLAILRQQGVLKAPSEAQRERESIQQGRDTWLADHRTREAQLENDRLNSRSSGSGQSQMSREHENRRRDQQEQRMMVESFKDYKPDVNIVYYDEFGRALSSKEAWKALSHRFHGKGSGKAKTEKRLKKIAEEKKREAMISGDTPLSMNKAFQTRQEKAGQAHMVLSVGNRGAAPQVADFLDAPPLSKNKLDKKAKKKEAAEFIASAVMANSETTMPEVVSQAIISAAPVSASPLPAGMMKPSFARITSSAEPGSGVSSPAGTTLDRTKLTIGLKRKADDDIGRSSSTGRR